MRYLQIGSCVAAFAAVFAIGGCDRREARVDDRPVAPANDTRFVDGAHAFSKYCALCHAADATGYAADHAPSLVSPTFLESATDEFIARGIRDGRPGTAMAAYGKSHGGPLDEADVAQIITFLRDKGPLRIRLPVTPVFGDAARGEGIYANSCRRCHGTRTDRGEAVQLANPMLLAAASDAFLRHAVEHGRPGTPMPRFAGLLGETQIADVVATLRSWATPPEAQRAPSGPEPPPVDRPVINPHGRSPEIALKGDRYAPIDTVMHALEAKNKMVIIDARAASDWYSMHIPGSISVPYYALTRLDGLPKDGTWIFAYCACPHHASGVIVDELRKRGYTRTAVLDEGILEWKKRGYPIASTPVPEQPKPGIARPELMKR